MKSEVKMEMACECAVHVRVDLIVYFVVIMHQVDDMRDMRDMRDTKYRTDID